MLQLLYVTEGLKVNNTIRSDSSFQKTGQRDVEGGRPRDNPWGSFHPVIRLDIRMFYMFENMIFDLGSGGFELDFFKTEQNLKITLEILFLKFKS